MRFESLLIKAFEKRLILCSDADTNCFRLFNTDGDGIPGLTIDIYGEYILMQYFSPQPAHRLEDVLQAFNESADIIPVAIKGVLMKNRTKAPGVNDMRVARESILVQGSPPPPGYVVRQNGVDAVVDLIRGQSSGIFLDMREVRDKLVRYYRPSDIMLNLFCYTALFSVHAVKNGIAGAVNVDLSKRVLERAKSNYRLNGLRIDERDFIYGDALEWIRIFRKKGKMFSLIIFDPPTFSRNRWRTFSSRKNYRKTLEQIGGLVEDGHVLTSVNSYSIPADEYKSFHPSSWKLELYCNESSDFMVAGRPYLKVGLWKIQ
jgi:23S rRNA (cytosine1962-C5)-methyltransferase